MYERKTLNNDHHKRDKIITGEVITKKYDVYHFDNMSLKTLEQLFAENFIDPEDTQNDCPSTQNILEFMRANPRFMCHGYAVTIDRDDYRVSIEGVTLLKKPTAKEREDFTDLFRCADDFVCNSTGCFCWYD